MTKRVNHEISNPSQTSQHLSIVDTTCVSHTISGPPTEAKSNYPHPPPPQSETVNPPEGIVNTSEPCTKDLSDNVPCLETFDTVIENLGNVVEKHGESMQVTRVYFVIKQRLRRNSELNSINLMYTAYAHYGNKLVRKIPSNRRDVS